MTSTPGSKLTPRAECNIDATSLSTFTELPSTNMDETAEPKLAKDGSVAKLLRTEARLPLSGGIDDMKEPLDTKDPFLSLSSGIEEVIVSKLERSLDGNALSLGVRDSKDAKVGAATGWLPQCMPADGSVVPNMPYVCPSAKGSSWFTGPSAG